MTFRETTPAPREASGTRAELPNGSKGPSPPSAAPRAEATEEAQDRRLPAASFIASDSTAELQPGQLRQSEFFERLEAAVCAEAEAALAGTPNSTRGCPYLAFFLEYYRTQGSSDLELTLRRYMPEAQGVRAASDYIPLVAARVRKSVEHWVRTGEVTGVPQDAPRLAAARTAAEQGQAAAPSAVQLKARHGTGRASQDPHGVLSALGPGRPLDRRVRGPMERSYGRSFAGVRLHTDATASRLSREQDAKAFTVGQHVAFAAGEYKPGTVVGDVLLAHELAHVVQQQEAGDLAAAPESRSSSYAALEADADRSAAGAVASLWGQAGRGQDSNGHRAPRLASGLRLSRCKNSPAPRPVLRKRTVRGPSTTDCGGSVWGVQWYLDNPGSTNGFIVQHVPEVYDVKDCSDNPIDIKAHTGGNLDPSWGPFWEAWEVRNGVVYVGTTTSVHNADTFGTSALGEGTKGSYSILATADYYPGVRLPSHFRARNRAPAWSLPYTKTNPRLTGGTGPLDHHLTARWSCCPGDTDKSTTLTTR